MSYSACYLGAMFSLGAATFNRSGVATNRCHPLARRQRQLAEELTRTCRLATTGTPTKLGPSAWMVPIAAEEKIVYGYSNHYYLT